MIFPFQSLFVYINHSRKDQKVIIIRGLHVYFIRWFLISGHYRIIASRREFIKKILNKLNTTDYT